MIIIFIPKNLINKCECIRGEVDTLWYYFWLFCINWFVDIAVLLFKLELIYDIKYVLWWKNSQLITKKEIKRLNNFIYDTETNLVINCVKKKKCLYLIYFCNAIHMLTYNQITVKISTGCSVKGYMVYFYSRHCVTLTHVISIIFHQIS